MSDFKYDGDMKEHDGIHLSSQQPDLGFSINLLKVFDWIDKRKKEKEDVGTNKKDI